MTAIPPASPEWLPLVNVTAEAIPGGAVVEPAGGYDALGRVRVRKCTADDSYAVYFNGPMGIAAASLGDPDEEKPGGLGRAAWPLAAAAVHPADLAAYTPRTPAGTKAGDWYLRTARRGFLFLDALADGTANVLPVPLGTAPPLSFGPTLDVVTNVCKAFNPYGVWIGNVVERRAVTFPVGTTFGARTCVTNPTNCCGTILSCPGCPDVALPDLTMNFTAKSGTATILPDSLPIVTVSGVRCLAGSAPWPTGSGLSPDPAYRYALSPDVDLRVGNLLDISCKDGGGYTFSFFTGPSYQLLPGPGYAYSPLGPVGSPNITGTCLLAGSNSVGCGELDDHGTLVLGTITNPGGFTSSVTLVLSW